MSSGSESPSSDYIMVNHAIDGYEYDGQSETDTGEYMSEISSKLWVYVGIPMLAMGTIGHMLSVMVLLGSKRMRLLSLSVYLVASAISGLAFIHVGLLRQILRNIDGSGKDVRHEMSDAGCRLHAAMTYLSLQLFSWLQASVAVERVIAVRNPLQYKRWCTWQRNVAVVASAALILASCNVSVVVSFQRNERLSCEVSEDYQYLFDHVWGILDLILYAAIPIAIMVPCNAITMYSMMKSKVCKKSTHVSTSIRRSRQFTVMLLAHNIVYIVTTLPISIIFLMRWPSDPESRQYKTMKLCWTIFSLLQYLGTTLGFTVYSMLAQEFRRAIQDLFCRGFNADISSDSANASTKSSCHSEGEGGTLLPALSHAIEPPIAIPGASQETQVNNRQFESR